MSNISRILGTDSRSDQLWSFFADNAITRREGRCQVFWGCHGCDNLPYHKDGHKCYCGKEPMDFSVLWGDGMTIAEMDSWYVNTHNLALYEANRSGKIQKSIGKKRRKNADIELEKTTVPIVPEEIYES